MVNIANGYQQRLEQQSLDTNAPGIPFYSSVEASRITNKDSFGPSYWVRNLMSTVLFGPAVQTLLDDTTSTKIFVEIGPHSALAGPLRQIFRAHSPTTNNEYIPTLARGKDATISLLKTAGELWLNNITPDFQEINGKGNFLVDLPLYPWHYEERLWIESRLSSEWRFRKHAHHDVLGSRVLETTDSNTAWRNILRLDSVPWIKGHEVAGDILFPGVGYIGQ